MTAYLSHIWTLIYYCMAYLIDKCIICSKEVMNSSVYLEINTHFMYLFIYLLNTGNPQVPVFQQHLNAVYICGSVGSWQYEEPQNSTCTCKVMFYVYHAICAFIFLWAKITKQITLGILHAGSFPKEKMIRFVELNLNMCV